MPEIPLDTWGEVLPSPEAGDIKKLKVSLSPRTLEHHTRLDRRQVRKVAEAFLGPGHTVAKRGRQGELWMESADGRRMVRMPTQKGSEYARTGTQANFHERQNTRTDWFDNQGTSNVHVNVKQIAMKPILANIGCYEHPNLRAYCPEDPEDIAVHIFVNIGRPGHRGTTEFTIPSTQARRLDSARAPISWKAGSFRSLTGRLDKRAWA